MYKFQTSRGPDYRGALRSRSRRRRGGRECGGGVPLPRGLEGLGEHRKLPHRGPGPSAPADHVLVHFELEKSPFGDKKCAILGWVCHT